MHSFMKKILLMISLLVASSLTATALACPKYPPLTHQQRLILAVQADGVQFINVGQTVKLVLGSNWLFNPRSANFNPKTLWILSEVAGLMKTYDMVETQVTAYTDAIGNAQHNQALSTRQAQVVASYLWKAGLQNRMIYAVGFGETRPVATNRYASSRVANNRIEIKFRYIPKRIAYN